MKNAIRTLLKSISSLLVNVTVTTGIGRYFLDQILSSVMSRTCSVRHQGLDLTFPAIFTIPRGVNVSVAVDAETATLLNGIDLTANDESIIQQLLANAPVMWTVTDLTDN